MLTPMQFVKIIAISMSMSLTNKTESNKPFYLLPWNLMSLVAKLCFGWQNNFRQFMVVRYFLMSTGKL